MLRICLVHYFITIIKKKLSKIDLNITKIIQLSNISQKLIYYV